MISEIEISNFQGHKYTNLILDPGVNTITGPSDSGKSSIIRALTWILKNRPRGDSFRNNSMKKKDSVRGAICFSDDSWVVREKGEKNQYETNSGVFKALRTDVPTEVSNITRIKNVNIQSQHPNEQYFMLTESPGGVAKKFNKVTGLTIMDDSLSEVNTMSRKTKQKAEFIGEQLTEKKDKEKELRWVNNALVSLKKIKALQEEKDTLVYTCNELDDCLDSIDDISKELKKYSNLKTVSKDLLEIEKDNKNFNKKLHFFKTLKYELKEIKNIDITLTSSLLLEKAETDFYTIRSLLNTTKEQKNRIKSIKIFLSQLKTIFNQISNTETNIKKDENFLKQFKGKICPICGGKI